MNRKHKMDGQAKRDLGWRREMAEEAGRDMGMTEGDFEAGDEADDADWRQNPELRRVEKKIQKWWREFRGRREGRRADDAIDDLSMLMLEMEAGLVRENVVGLRACSNEMAEVLRDGGLREFGEAGCWGEKKRIMLAWVYIRCWESAEMIARLRAKSEPKWRVGNFEEWYQVYVRGCRCQLRWFDTVMSEGLRWGMDVFGWMGIEDPIRYQTVQLEVLDLMVARGLTQLSRLMEWWYALRNSDNELALAGNRVDDVDVDATGSRKVGEDNDSEIGDSEDDRGNAGDKGDDNGELVCRVYDGGNDDGENDGEDNNNGDNSDVVRYDWQLLLVHVGLVLACAMSLLVCACWRLQLTFSTLMGTRQGLQAGSINKMGDAHGQQHRVMHEARSDAIYKGVKEARRQRAAWVIMQKMKGLAREIKMTAMWDTMRRGWEERTAAIGTFIRILEMAIQRWQMGCVWRQMTQGWREKATRRRIHIREVGKTATANEKKVLRRSQKKAKRATLRLEEKQETKEKQEKQKKQEQQGKQEKQEKGRETKGRWRRVPADEWGDDDNGEWDCWEPSDDWVERRMVRGSYEMGDGGGAIDEVALRLKVPD